MKVLVAGMILISVLVSGSAHASPSAETAKQCLRAAYMLYPYKRPGAGPMKAERLSFFNQCMAGQNATATEPKK